MSWFGRDNAPEDKDAEDSSPSCGPVLRIKSAISDVVSTFGLASRGITGLARVPSDVEDAACGCTASGWNEGD